MEKEVLVYPTMGGVILRPGVLAELLESEKKT